jgi:ADP-heptose:LPS heptosyltransferase
MAPTSRWPGKQWPPERFAQAATALLDRRGLLGQDAFKAAVLVGSATERSQIRPLLELAAGDSRIIDLVGSTSVARLLALVREARLVIGNDSAAVHMAVGFDRPLIALYGPTDVSRVGPYQREADVIQRVEPGDTLNHKDASVGRRLMARISSAEVIERAVRLATDRGAISRLCPAPAREPRSPAPAQGRSGTSPE